MGDKNISGEDYINGIIKNNVNYDDYVNIVNYGTKLIKTFHDVEKNGISLDTTITCMNIWNVLNIGVNIEIIEQTYGGEVAHIMHNVNREIDNNMLSAYDLIFIKLIIRLSCIHQAINNVDSVTVKNYIDQYSDLRRKILRCSDSDILQLMDYEADLIRYARNVFSGKAAGKYVYKNLILD
jgi:hypothetical protein